MELIGQEWLGLGRANALVYISNETVSYVDILATRWDHYMVGYNSNKFVWRDIFVV